MGKNFVASNGKKRADVQEYLRNVNPEHFHPKGWGAKWAYGHGEGRSSATYTYHIGFMKASNGHYRTIMVVNQAGQNIPVTTESEGLPTTQKEWGLVAPDPEKVLEFYKKQWGVWDGSDGEEEGEGEGKEEVDVVDGGKENGKGGNGWNSGKK